MNEKTLHSLFLLMVLASGCGSKEQNSPTPAPQQEVNSGKPESKNSTLPSNPNPNSQPEDPEAVRIANRQVKDTASVEFVAYLSKQDGCQPVITRTMAQVKAAAASPGVLGGLVSLSKSSSTGLLETTFKFALPSSLLRDTLSFGVRKQSNYASDWDKKIEDKLLLQSGNAKVSLDSTCGRDGDVPWAQNIFAWNDLPLWRTDTALPLTPSGNAPDVQFTYRTDAGSESMRIEIGVDTTAVLQKMRVQNASEVTKVQWMLGHVSSSTYYSISDWTDLGSSAFFSNKLTLDTGSLARRGVFHFYSGAVAFRVFKMNSTVATNFILNTGKLCQAAYTRQDGAEFHSKLFRDLTHPEWNGAPSKQSQQGCLYIGAKWW